MKGINKVMLVGYLGATPELSQSTSSAECVTKLSLATNEAWNDKQTGEVKTRTEWHCITLFRHLAEYAGAYLKKGDLVHVEGYLRTCKRIGQNGEEKYTLAIYADSVQRLGSRKTNQNGIDTSSDVQLEDESIVR
jgi:single-strand DNA-binding protein